MNKLGTFIASTIAALAQIMELLLIALRPSSSGRIRGEVIDRLGNHLVPVRHNGVAMHFYAPNWLTSFRASSFSDKEPDTLNWIDSFNSDDIFWDIGANVGIYSVYAALRHPQLKVFVFEPSVFNLELLVRNLTVNGVSDRSVVIPQALSNSVALARFKLVDTEHGSAHSAFGVDYGQDGQTKTFESFYEVPGTTVDAIIAQYRLPSPNHIKLDVDGIEHLILLGASETLLAPSLRSVLVEIDDHFVEQREVCYDLMTRSRFVRTTSFQDDVSRSPHIHANSIWVRAD